MQTVLNTSIKLRYFHTPKNTCSVLLLEQAMRTVGAIAVVGDRIRRYSIILAWQGAETV